METNKAYHEETDIRNIKKLRELLQKLPPFTQYFFRGIEQTTATRTRLAYAYDLIVFFNFIKNKTNLMEDPGENFENVTVDILDRISSIDIENYMSYLFAYETDSAGHSERNNKCFGQKRKLSSLRTFYRYYFRKEMIHSNPSELVDMPKLIQKNIIRLDAAEVAELVDQVESGDHLTKKEKEFHKRTEVRDFAMICLMLGTGIRVSECVGLNVDDVDLKETCAKIFRKGGKEAVVYFSDEVARALAPYLEQRKDMNPVSGHENALFLSLQNKRMSVRAVEKMVKKYTSGVTTMKKITPHKLRSTFGTALYQETGDIYLVASVLGHSDVNTTKKHYADIENDSKRMARNIVKLRDD